MDVMLSKKESPKFRRRIIAAVLVGLGTVGWVALYRMESLAVSVSRAKLWMGTVERGLFVQQVHGSGELVAEETRFVTISTAGTVERILCRSGSRVEEDTVILELSNPDIEQEVLAARTDLMRLQADIDSLKMQQHSQQLNTRSTIARYESNYKEAQLEASANENLLQDGLVPRNLVEKLRLREREQERLLSFERERLKNQESAAESALKAKEASLECAQARLALSEKRLDALKVRAGAVGILQKMALEIGQRLSTGRQIAEVSDASRLKAVVRIPATQVKDVAVGQVAVVDTHDGLIDGVVAHIDPTVQEGNIRVTIRLTSSLPKGARPELNVEGRIELQRVEDLLYVKRPALCREESAQQVFKLDPETGMAEQTRVQFGRISVNTIEVIEGLAVGDEIILSDTEQWEKHQRIKVK